ncbi:MAG: UvrD-helicase domain-containing protein [Phycisphaerales bacterium]|nr:UvrD-helicase domain-containing protein [Phycisphaerales bacterium]
MTESKHILADQAQRDTIQHRLDVVMLVEASAGTGKTYSMVQRMMELIRAGVPADSLAAITFTKKAAAELQGRFFKALQNTAADSNIPPVEQERFAQAASMIDRCFLGTIHSFCGRMLRERPLEAGVGMNFTELDDEADRALQRHAWELFVSECYGNQWPWIERLDNHGLRFGDLRAAFGDYCNYPDVASWPSEKTDLPTEDELRFAHEEFLKLLSGGEAVLSQIRAQQTPAIEFAKNTDGLLALYADPPLGYAHLQFDTPHHRRDAMLYFEALKPVPKLIQKYWPGEKGERKERCLDAHAQWETFYSASVEPVLAKLRASRYALILELFAEAQKVYDQLRRNQNVLNFQDLLMKTAAMLRTHRPVREYFQSKVHALLVDEFQDTDPIQAEIMLLLTADDPAESDYRAARPQVKPKRALGTTMDIASLFVVGDPKQSIYRFRRADIQTYDFVKDRIQAVSGAAGLQELNTNFRSSRSVIQWVNGQFGREGTLFPLEATTDQAAAKDMNVGNDEADLPASADLHGVKSVRDDYSGKSSVSPYQLEAQRIAAYIHDAVTEEKTIIDFDGGRPHLRPVCYGDFLILLPKRKPLAVYGEALLARDIPAQVTGGSQLNEIEELALVRRAAEALLAPDNPVALVAMLRSGLFGLDDESLLQFKRAGGVFDYRCDPPESLPEGNRARFVVAFAKLRTYRDWLDAQPPPVVVLERMLSDLGLLLRTASRNGFDGTLGGLSRTIELLRGHLRTFALGNDIPTLLADLVDKQAQFDVIPARPPQVAPVRVMNLHKAKGLEAPVVFLAGARGKTAKSPRLHIDRNGDRVRGYMVFRGAGFHGGAGKLLACPSNWDQQEESEKTFLDAEATRLLYVAATRAGRCLVVAQRKKWYKSNPWADFHEAMETAEPLALPAGCDLPPVPAAPSARGIELDLAERRATLASQKRSALTPSYETVAAKAAALGDAHPTAEPGDADSRGMAWGTAVHELLDHVFRRGAGDLASAAGAMLESAGLDSSLRDSLVETVETVQTSDLWQRALRAEECYSEVPYTAATKASGSGHDVIERGVIDLAFREEAGWVLVDYKTDAAAANRREELVEYYRPQLESYARAWAGACGDVPITTVLLFTATNQTVTL